MKEIAIVNLTKNTMDLNNEITQILERHGYQCLTHTVDKKASIVELGTLNLKEVKNWIDDIWMQMDAFVFIGGIDTAMRLILTKVESPIHDPAVLVIDEECKYIVPILGNHIGLGNEVAQKLAKLVNAKEIITTPKEVREKFTIEKFAERNEMEFGKKEQARAINTSILEGHYIAFYSEYPVEGDVPNGLIMCQDENELARHAHKIAIRNEYIIGMGLKERVPYGYVEELFLEEIEKMKIEISQISGIATVHENRDESALRLLSEEYKIPILSYSIEEFRAINSMNTSEAMKKIDANVSERAAILGSDYGELVVPRVVGKGVTFAAAKKVKTVYFD